jgi:hypothetical protein
MKGSKHVASLINLIEANVDAVVSVLNTDCCCVDGTFYTLISYL